MNPHAAFLRERGNSYGVTEPHPLYPPHSLQYSDFRSRGVPRMRRLATELRGSGFATASYCKQAVLKLQ